MSRVGYNSKSNEGKVLSASNNALAGAITGTATRAICQPLDVLKIRLQLQAEDNGRAKYKSIRHALRSIMREEGVFAYWKGHVPGQYLSLLYGSLSIGIYQTLWQSSFLKSQIQSSTKSDLMLTDICVGTLSSIPATMLAYPFDIVRTRIVGQSPVAKGSNGKQKPTYSGVFSALAKITRTEGWRANYKGLSVALMTVPVNTGISLCIYNVITPFVLPSAIEIQNMGIPLISDVAVGVLGGIAGISTKTIVYPMDTIKKRLQVQGFSEGRMVMGCTPRYLGFRNCLITIYHTEGIINGLYKGWTPGIIKAFVSKAVYFMILERSLYLIEYARNL